MMLAQALVSKQEVRFDKRVVSLVFAAGLGWLGSNAYYHVGWLEYRSDELQQVSTAVGGHKAISAAATVTKAINLKKQTGVAVALGCLPPEAAK